MPATKEARQVLTRDVIKKIHEDLIAAVEPVIKQHGLAMAARPTRMSFTSTDFKFSVEAAVTNSAGDVETKEASTYRQLATIYEMEPTWLFKHLKTSAGPIYKILGLNTRSRKMPVLAERDGKTYKVSALAFKGAKLID